MGFSGLFKRENVYPILADTLFNYYSQRFPNDDIYIGYKKKADSRCFIIVPRFGMIMPPFPKRNIRNHYYYSYNIRNNFVKNIIAKVLIFLATHLPVSITTSKKLYIAPNYILNDETIFAYCNRSIRIFDFENNISVSIQKKGFTDYFFNKQLKFRLNNHFCFIPTILNNDENWFAEPLLDGHMLARETDPEKYAEFQSKAIDYVHQIGANTESEEEVSSYSLSLIRKIENQLSRALSDKQIMTYSKTNDIILSIKNYLIHEKNKFPCVVSHGDFQAGNIWVSKDNVYIIDWETVDKRSCWYDEITIKYGTRYYGGVKRLVDDVLSHSLCVTLNSKFESLSEKAVLALYVLEDIEFYLEDMLELPGVAGKKTFDQYMNELSEISWGLVLS